MAIRVGFIGLGNQGKPIAAHLPPAGIEPTVYDLVREPMEELVATGVVCGWLNLYRISAGIAAACARDWESSDRG